MEAYESGGRDEHEKVLHKINLTKRRLRGKRHSESEYSLRIRNLVRSPNTMPNCEALKILKEFKLCEDNIHSLMGSAVPDADRFFKSIQHLEMLKTT